MKLALLRVREYEMPPPPLMIVPLSPVALRGSVLPGRSSRMLSSHPTPADPFKARRSEVSWAVLLYKPRSGRSGRGAPTCAKASDACRDIAPNASSDQRDLRELMSMAAYGTMTVS